MCAPVTCFVYGPVGENKPYVCQDTPRHKEQLWEAG